MRNFIKYGFAFMVLNLGSVYAQKSTIDSPHNYKRPVFQQRKSLIESNSVTVFSQSSHQIKNDISSVHNYKRQGRADFIAEAAIIVQMPAKTIGLNPLLSLDNYKAIFKTTLSDEKISQPANMNLRQTTTDNIKFNYQKP
jgi:hypothetical protein